MSDEFSIHINFITTNPLLAKQSFDMLKTYIEEEVNTQYIIEVLPQMTALLKSMQKNDMDLEFLDNQEFKPFKNKIRLLFSYPEVKDFFVTLEGESDNRNLGILREDLDSFLNDSQKSCLDLANAYVEFYDTLKKSLSSGQWQNINDCWNKHAHFFNPEKISYSSLSSLFPNVKLSTEANNSYLKLIKNSQEKIAETLWNQFFLHPEDSEKLSTFVPDFFQFINWLSKADNTSRNFADLLEQKHWDNLAYASKIPGFDFFLENIFLLKEKDVLDSDSLSSNPFKSGVEYRYINIDTIKTFNQKNINMDVVLKGNTLGLPEHLRDYLYHHISLFEKSDKKHSTTEFAELDKLLIVYEKQKLESIFVVKNVKSKKAKI